MDRHINREQLAAFEHHLWVEEREAGTIEKYLRDIRAFAAPAGRLGSVRAALAGAEDTASHDLTSGFIITQPGDFFQRFLPFLIKKV